MPAITDGEVLLHVDRCALTANNITYGAFGDLMGYWSFFPADDGWGRIPVWGFADVEASTIDGLVEGERIYGYFPMSTHLVVRADRVGPTSFVDAADHRSGLPPVYNQYQRLADRASDHDEHLRAVLRPLFTTSFLIDDWLAGESWFHAERLVVSSASSKTALALAASLRARRTGAGDDRAGHAVEIVGLTSARNADVVERIGYYDRTVVYTDIDDLEPDVPTVLVDMGGDAEILGRVHGHLAEVLRHSCQVGATHWEALALGIELPGPRPQLFFAPDHVQRRLADWGAAGFEERLGSAWASFAESATSWLDVDLHLGPDAVASAYHDVLEGRLAPDRAVVFSLEAPPDQPSDRGGSDG